MEAFTLQIKLIAYEVIFVPHEFLFQNIETGYICDDTVRVPSDIVRVPSTRNYLSEIGLYNVQ